MTKRKTIGDYLDVAERSKAIFSANNALNETEREYYAEERAFKRMVSECSEIIIKYIRRRLKQAKSRIKIVSVSTSGKTRGMTIYGKRYPRLSIKLKANIGGISALGGECEYNAHTSDVYLDDTIQAMLDVEARLRELSGVPYIREQAEKSDGE